MKNLRQFFILAIITISGCGNLAAEIADSSIQVTYIGSTGYLLETAHKKVLIDPTYGDIVQGFGYPYASTEVESKLLSAEAPFDNIDLILISHIHLGHFDAYKTFQCLKANSNAILVTTQGVADSIAGAADDYASVESRIYVPELETYAMKNAVVNDFPLTITKIDHWGPTELLQFSFKMDSLNVAYYLDYKQQEGKEHHAKTENIDIAILDGALMLDDAKREVFKTDFDVKYTVFTHFTNTSSMEAKIEENKGDLPDVGYMAASLDCQLFNFSNGATLMEQINSAPVFSQQLENDTIMVGANYSVDLSDLISDAEGHDVVLSATMNNGMGIPDWIYIDDANKVISLTATEAQTIALQLIVTDESGAWTKASKKIIVLDPTSTSLRGINNQPLLVYPSRASNFINIDISNLSETNLEVSICDMRGRLVKQMMLNERRTKINVSAFEVGMYIVFLKGKEVTYSCSFVKNTLSS